jgi:hypothetical protein
MSKAYSYPRFLILRISGQWVEINQQKCISAITRAVCENRLINNQLGSQVN